MKVEYPICPFCKERMKPLNVYCDLDIQCYWICGCNSFPEELPDSRTLKGGCGGVPFSNEYLLVIPLT